MGRLGGQARKEDGEVRKEAGKRGGGGSVLATAQEEREEALFKNAFFRTSQARRNDVGTGYPGSEFFVFCYFQGLSFRILRF